MQKSVNMANYNPISTNVVSKTILPF